MNKRLTGKERRNAKAGRVTRVVMMQDLRELAKNVAGRLQSHEVELSNSYTQRISLAVAFDAMLTLLDKFMTTKEYKLDGSPKLFTDYLKEELERRQKESAKPAEEKPVEEKKEPDANPSSNP